ncbi:MAG: hypothetical protein HKN40_05830 [Winogradskyella sp.]|uniref:hypothetical protein n=1 Tax=Winogradskyella sp. TaxID=1883156 RepID=UPI0017F56FA3|nr:hypothetical protein [Winogradskyella sp.]
MIDPDKIFGLFGRADDNPTPEEREDITQQLIELKESPAFKIGVFRKLILNHTNFNLNLLNMLKRAHSELDVDDMNNASEYIVYTRAWEYIKDLNAKDVEVFEAIKKGANEELVTTLALAINFFEEKEEYKKCAHLKKLSDISRYFLE